MSEKLPNSVNVNTVDCSINSLDNDYINPIKVYLIDNDRMYKVSFIYISDLYKYIRRKFIRDSHKYALYYYEYDIPRFYFTYQGKILFESFKSYIDYNIHSKDYLFLEYATLSGGNNTYSTIPPPPNNITNVIDTVVSFSLFGHIKYFTISNLPTVSLSYIINIIIDRYLPATSYIKSFIYCEVIDTIELSRWNSDNSHLRIPIALWAINYNVNFLIRFVQGPQLFDPEYCNTQFFCDHMYYDPQLKEQMLNFTHTGLSLQSSVMDYIPISHFNSFSHYNQDYIIKLIEDLAVLINGLRKSYKDDFNKSTIIEYVIIFLKLRNQQSLVKTIYDSGIIDYLDFIIKDSSDAMTLQSSHPLFESARGFLKSVKDGTSTKFCATAYRVGMFILSTSIFKSSDLILDTMGYNKFEQQLLKKHNRLSGNLALDIAEGTLFLLEKGYQIIITKSFDCIYHTETEYGELYDTIMDLKTKQHALSNPEAFGFSEAWYIKTLDDTVEKLKTVIKYAGINKSSEIKVFRNYLCELEVIKINRVLTMVTQEFRQAPFSLLFFAQPGVGKTTLLKMVFRHFGNTHNLPTEDSYMYTRNPAANYADGFRTEMWCWVQDDIAYMKPTKNPNGDPTTAETIQLNNYVQFTPDQAAIENKGKTPFRGKLLMGTTNVCDLNAYHYFSCPSALQRRYPFVIEVAVKPQYCKPDSKMLDPTKADCPPGHYPNYWIFTINKVIVPEALHHLAKKKTLHVFDDVNDFLAWVSTESIQHFVDATKMVDSFKNMQNIEICKLCYKNQNVCICVQQSLPVYGIYSLTGGLFSFYFTRYAMSIWPRFKTFVENVIINCILYCLVFSHTFTTLLFYLWFRQQVDNFLWWIGAETARIRIDRGMFARFGGVVKRQIGEHPHFAWLIVAITSCYSIIKLSTKLNLMGFEQQSLEESIPRPLREERDNPWVAKAFKLSNLDLTSPIISSKQHSEEKFIDMITPNVCFAYVHDIESPKHKWGNNILCIKGNIYVSNAHWFNGLNAEQTHFRMIIINDDSGEGIRNHLTVTLRKDSLHHLKDKDIVAFELPHLPPKRDISQYFASSKVSVRAHATLVTRKKKGEVKLATLENVYISHNSDNLEGIQFSHHVTMGISSHVTENGDCGSPLIMHSPKGHFIISLHRAGNDGKSIMGTCIFSEMVTEIVQEFPCSLVTDGPPALKPEHLQLQTLHPKSTVNYMESGSAIVYGSLSGFKTKHKSRVGKTLMRDFLLKHGYEVKFTAPNLGGWKPWRLALEDLTVPVTHFDVSIVRACGLSFTKHLLKHLPIDTIKEIVHKYDQFTAINGAAGVAYVDSLNRQTSAGYPHYSCKMNFMRFVPPAHGLEDPVEITPEIQARIDQIEYAYNNGLRWKPIFIAALKDEPITFAKALAHKIRMFGSAPLDWIIVVRKYLLSFIRLMQNYKLVFECAIGTVAQSREWDDIYAYLTEFGEDQMIAGDFRKYDKTMSPVFILTAFQIITAVCQISGNYSFRDIVAIFCIAFDTAFPLMDFNGDLIQFLGSNPSGHSLTVIINSLVNSLYMRYVFVILYCKHIGVLTNIEEILDMFDDKVRLITYGDDNVLNVSPDIPWYNHTTISETFKEIGIDYTMADKEAESVPYINIKDVSFLKRKWVWDEKLKSYMAPLAHESIEKMLTTWVASDTVSPRCQCLDVVSSALREYFFYGKTIFEEKRILFIELLISLDLAEFINNKKILPTYDMLVQTYEENSKRIHAGKYKLQSSREIYVNPIAYATNMQFVIYLGFFIPCYLYFACQFIEGICFVVCGHYHSSEAWRLKLFPLFLMIHVCDWEISVFILYALSKSRLL